MDPSGSDCFVGHGVKVINDPVIYGPGIGDWLPRAKKLIGNHVSIGSNATIMPVAICG